MAAVSMAVGLPFVTCQMPTGMFVCCGISSPELDSPCITTDLSHTVPNASHAIPPSAKFHHVHISQFLMHPFHERMRVSGAAVSDLKPNVARSTMELQVHFSLVHSSVVKSCAMIRGRTFESYHSNINELVAIRSKMDIELTRRGTQQESCCRHGHMAGVYQCPRCQR